MLLLSDTLSHSNRNSEQNVIFMISTKPAKHIKRSELYV